MHLHITVAAEPSEVEFDLDDAGLLRKPRGTKLTVIRLWDPVSGRSQVDVMLTLHCRPGEEYAKLAELTKWCVLRRLPIIRAKIEADLMDGAAAPLYYETHIALPADADPVAVECVAHIWRLGRSENVKNPRPGEFLTFRCTDKPTADMFAQCVYDNFPTASLWPELVMYDSNPEHDAWWVHKLT